MPIHDETASEPMITTTTRQSLAGFGPVEELSSGKGRSHGTSASAPFDRWFRYPAGFASDYVSLLLRRLDPPPRSLILDPFAGSAVTGTSARKLGYSFYGIEAHPGMVELAATKLHDPPSDPSKFVKAVEDLNAEARNRALRGEYGQEDEPDLIVRSFEPRVLTQLVAIRDLIKQDALGQWTLYGKWALLATLRDVASVRVGWPYQSPNQQKKARFADPFTRFNQRVLWMAEDLRLRSRTTHDSQSMQIIHGSSADPSAWDFLEPEKAQGCVSSPPYLNNFDYADATRLEMYFWGDVRTWAELCAKVRSKMITATTQQSSVGGAQAAQQSLSSMGAVAQEVSLLAEQLKEQRKSRERGKEYDRVVPDYFAGIARVLSNLATALAPGSAAVWLVGDSAPYGVYVDTPAIIGRLAEQVGFIAELDIPLRQRGNRWAKNPGRHTVDLSERLILLRRK